MKNARRKLLDNKGAALVTILIAVTFMTIMASSLMYMAYMNYLTKSMRYSATDNFYTDEFALDDLATTLQETAAKESTIDDARNAVLAAVGDRSVGGYRAYTNDDVAALMGVASQEATISVNCALEDLAGNLTEDSLIVEDDYIKLRGVRITATTPEGYQSTITSDVTISFPSTIPGMMDINDFSVITDSPLEFSNGGARYFSGNVFAQKTGAGGGTALKVTNNTVVGLLSQQVMIVGDVEVTGNSTLHVTGNMTVYGKVTVEEGSALICSGKILHSEEITGDGTFKGITEADKAPMEVARSPLLPDDGLVDSLFLDVWVRNNNGDEKTFDIASLEALGGVETKFTTGNLNDPRCFIFSSSKTLDVGENSEYENALILVEASNLSYPTTLSLAVHDGVMAQTTIMSTGPVVYHYEQGTSYMSKMSDEAFEFAKNYLFSRSGQIDVKDTPDGGSSRVNIGGGSNDISLASGRVENIPGGVNTFTRGGDGREFKYDDSGKNYLPIYYFLDEDSSDIISKIFAAPTGTSDPRNSIIIYELWSKD